MFTQINNFITWFDGVVWGLPLIILILITGFLLTVRLGFLQVRHLGKALKFMVKNEEGGEGEVTSFGALCTALSATIGTGNIVGVATAIAAGGPGALFWMIVAAFFGMATKYAEGLLAIKYRTIDKDGHVLGGPFYYIENGMGKQWRWLAKIFAFFGAGVGLFGIGTFTQVNGIASAVKNFFDPDTVHTVFLFGNTYSWATVIACLILTLCVGLVVLGGIQRIAKVSQIIVPFMAVLYVALALIIVITNITAVPGAIATIVKTAFNGSALAGGAMGTMVVAMQKGIARGIFSNESGLGSAKDGPVIRERVKLNRMTGYLTEHCNEKLTLSAMAEACQVSTGDFCRFFKKHMEMTPFEYLQKCRIWNSMDAVLEKTASMGDIAVENGFAGASYFSETFRKEMGCSPADYRKWYRDLSDECPIITGENKEESAKVSKKDKKGKSGKNVPSYLL